MVELNILTGERVQATGVVRESGSVLVVPAPEFRAILGGELVFGDFVLQTLFRRRRALERLRMGIQIVGSRFDPDTHRLREFAARNRVVHDWLDIDDPRAEALLGAHADVTSGSIILLGGASEDKVASFDRLVAGKIGLVNRLVGGFAVVKLSERPPGGLGRIFLSS